MYVPSNKKSDLRDKPSEKRKSLTFQQEKNS